MSLKNKKISGQQQLNDQNPAQNIENTERRKEERPSFFSFFNKKEKQKDEVSITGKKIKKEEKINKEKKATLNPAIVNVITPVNILIERNHVYLGENKAAVYGMVEYPAEPEYGWLRNIANLPSTIFHAKFRATNHEQLIDELNYNINRTKLTLGGSIRDYSEEAKLENRLENQKLLVKRIIDNQEKVGMLSTEIMIYGRSEEEFLANEERMKTKSREKNTIIRNLSLVQEKAFKNISPFYNETNEVQEAMERVFPLSSFVGGFPFVSYGYNDGSGAYFGKDETGGLVFLDLWKRGKDRTNSNITVTGGSGAGKSTKLKDLSRSEYVRGTKIIYIDPEGEYITLTKRLGGNVINAGGGAKGRINPLQIRPIPKYVKDIEPEELQRCMELGKDPYDDGDESDKLPDVAGYMNLLETFFKMYLPSLKDSDIAVLKKTLLELYQKFGVTWDTDVTKLKNDQFPLMEDLWRFIEEKEKVETEVAEKLILGELKRLLYDAAFGADSFLWNGYTEIDTDPNIICFDTSGLDMVSNKTKSAQYFNIANYCWQLMSRDREERVMLICDEAWIMIDPEVPQSLSFLKNAAKRARKYESSLVIASHLIIDFLDARIAKEGRSLLGLPTYKVFMGTDGIDLQELRDLYNLNESEVLRLEAKKQGSSVCMIGSKRMSIDFELAPYKLELFGKGGGR